MAVHEDRQLHAAMRVKQTIDQVQVSRATASGAGCQLSTELGFGARSECGRLLVTDMDPLQLAVAAHSVGNRV